MSATSIRMAAAQSLATGAKMVPVTKMQTVENVLKHFGKMGEINLPGAGRAVKELVDTGLGPLQVTVTDLGGVKDLADRIKTLVHRQTMLTANPQTLQQLYAAGDKIAGIGSVSFEWPSAAVGKSMTAPVQGLGAGQSRSVLRAVKDIYQNQVVPRLMELNPGKALLLANEPTSLRRASLYQRAGMMGSLDPLGSQHSLILPSGNIKPVELFGGGIPSWLMD
jgi:hypothetical protein